VDTPPVANVVCATDWGAIAEDDVLATGEMPAVVTFAATRTVKADHYLANGIYTTAISDPDTLCFEPGEYETLLYTCVPRDAYDWENMDSFKEDNASSLRGIRAVIPSISKEWYDYTWPGYYTPLYVGGFAPVRPAAPLYRAEMRQRFANGDQTLVYSPTQLAMNVSFRIHVKADEKMKPNRVVASVSGVPFKAELLTGYVQVDTLGQTFFEMYKISESAEEEVYEGTLALLGIYPPTDDDVKVGPGILRVCIDAGVKRRLSINVVNLKSQLESLDPMIIEATDIEGFFKKGKRSVALIDLESVIVLESSDTGGEDPLNDWTDPDDGATKDLTDGDNEDE